MSDQVQEKHQLAGLDERERGFSRPVVYQQADGGYQAILRMFAGVGQDTV